MASVDEDLTGRENLVLLGWLLGLKRAAAKARAAELLEVFGLDEAAGRLVKNYSGGMRRRLDLAASIVVTPELMFLDEPTTGLDPRSRNQVWDIIRALRAEGTTILLCTQYLDEADQLADGIAVIDHGKVIAEGTPGQLKASVGSGALHVRLLDPEQRAAAEALLARELGTVQLEPDPAALTAPCANADRGAEAVAALTTRASGSPTSPSASRASTRCSSPSPGTRPSLTKPCSKRSVRHDTDELALRNALASTPRPPRVSAASAAMAFGWRGMLKVRHVPEQLLDVTITPVMFVLMFTYLFGGAISGSTGEYLDYILPGILVMSVLFTTVYSGVALNTDLTKGVVDRFRSLPIARPAPLVGALLGDTVRYLVAGTVIVVLGVILGYRPGAGVPGVLAAMALVIVFAFGLSWVFTTLGPAAALAQRRHERGLHGDLPADVPEQRVRRPGDAAERARGVRERQPDLDPGRRVSRGLMEGNADGSDIAIVLGTAAALTAVFAPLTTRLYRSRVTWRDLHARRLDSRGPR